jgi:FAD/FMN-containing dehydrogenase
MAARHRLTGRVVRPGDPGYDAARASYNARFDVRPRVIVFCQTPDDVANAVRWARQEGIEIRVASGRHSYEAFCIGEGIVIDVSEMNAVEVDAVDRLATVGAGTRLLPLYEALWKEGLTVPAGSCGTVGIAGLALGGGFGLLSRAMGLTCDNVLRVEMVTASGERITASDAQCSDLLWACRGGGGGSFGVVTSFTFRLHAIGDVTTYRMDWPWERLGEVLEAWQRWAPFVDDRLTSILSLHAGSAGQVSSIGLFIGPKAALRPLLEPLCTAVAPSTIQLHELPYIEAARRYAGVKPNHRRWRAHWHAGSRTHFKNTSDFARSPLGAEAIAVIRAVIREFLARAPNKRGILQLDAYGGAVNRVPAAATAFPHREGTLYSMQYQSYWKSAKQEGENIQWVDAFRAAMQPHVSGAAYVNYCDRAIDDWQHAYYGSGFPRLVAVKMKYDPEDVFHHPQSIPVGRAAGPTRAQTR